MNKNNKILVVYYSYTQHTKMIAESIKDSLKCDILELRPTKPYSEDYDFVVNQAQEEANNKFMPEIENINIDLSDYDTVILGTPVWWYTMAPVVRTFLSKNDLSNKKIIPFATNAGWLGHTFVDIKKLCPKSLVENEESIVFTEDYREKQLVTSPDEIDKWIERIEK